MDNLYFYVLPILFLFVYNLRLYFLHRIQNLPPTPFPSLPFLGHLYLFITKKPLHRAFSKLSKRYGPVVFLRLGSRRALIVSSPVIAQECFTKNDIIFANRPNLLNGKVFGYNYTSLVWSPHSDHWRNLRRISSLHLLSSHKVQMSSNIQADEARILIRKVVQFTNDNPNKAVEFKRVLFEFTFNVITRMITGKNYKIGADIFQEIINEVSRVTMEANVVDVLPFMKWFGCKNTEKKMRLIHMKREKFMQNIIDEHRRIVSEDERVKEKSTLQVLLDLQREEPEYYSDETIRNLLLVLVHGATHTTSVTIEWAFSHLLDNPYILRRAQADIDTLVGKERLIDESDIAELPYLRCIVDETLRLHPAAPLLMPHISSGECTVGGFRIPHGTILFVNVWDIQNDNETWVDAEKFKPERFESFRGGKNELKFFPFGWGRRACPGENLAMRVVELGLGSLIQCFEWEKIGKIDISEDKGIVTPKIHPLIARCNPRPFVYNLINFENK